MNEKPRLTIILTLYSVEYQWETASPYSRCLHFKCIFTIQELGIIIRFPIWPVLSRYSFAGFSVLFVSEILEVQVNDISSQSHSHKTEQEYC